MAPESILPTTLSTRLHRDPESRMGMDSGFVSTRWSMVAKAGGDEPATSHAALTWLIERYWDPLRFPNRLHRPPSFHVAILLVVSSFALAYGADEASPEQAITGTIVHIDGTGDNGFLRTDTRSVRMYWHDGPSPAPGDVIQAHGHFRPKAKGAIFDAERMITSSPSGTPPSPREMPENGPYPFDRWQFELATFTCELIDSLAVVDDTEGMRPGIWLQVIKNGRWIRAYLKNDDQSGWIKSIRPNSIIRLTGICHLDSPASDGTSRGFLLNLRNHADVVVMNPGPWWTRERMIWATALLICALLLALLAIHRLATSVSRKQVIIDEQIEKRAVLEERQRIAGELHDTLEQELVGVRFQVESARSCLTGDTERARQCLDDARSLLERSQRESRATILALRSTDQRLGLLVAHLTGLLPSMFPDDAHRIAIKVTGEEFPIPRRIAFHLERMIRECVFNACRHAQATRITVGFRFERAALQVEVGDDGIGFEPALFEHPPAGHFGFHGIRERALKIGASVTIASSGGKGTTITLNWDGI